jgi:hypothetical protein
MSHQSNDLRVDVDRNGDHHGTTGIYVRAKDPWDSWANADIAELDRVSLLRWLRSRGGENLWAENTVMALLGHKQFQADEALTALKEVSDGPR